MDEQQPPSKRRRKTENGEVASGAEPRRLRRSHEACSRCRTKKIKCDSKQPRCSACAAVGVSCNQEDRQRQTLTPRGQYQYMEHMLRQCRSILLLHRPDFSLYNLEEIVDREGIQVEDVPIPTLDSMLERRQQRPAPPPPPPPPPVPQPTAQVYTPDIVSPQSYAPMYSYQLPYDPPPPPQQQQQQQQAAYVDIQDLAHLIQTDIKGQDPKANDMSNTQALAKNFGVSASIVNDLKLPDAVDSEDLAVGSNGLSSGRDRILESSTPRDIANWLTVSFRRSAERAAIHPPSHMAVASPVPDSPTDTDVWLPRDRTMVNHIVNVYFTHLNLHRPVFSKEDFEKNLDDLYSERMVSHDPGFICSVYLILALGTLSELNHRVVQLEHESTSGLGHEVSKKYMPLDWPEHDEFFERALLVKPDLLVTISSLQALILLHWYLYTERQFRTLWRLVGSLVRLSIELGLHHDPTTQFTPTSSPEERSGPLFTEEECQLRIRLWGIVLVHDRGTSLLLGRPLGIAPSDANTPRPSRAKNNHISDFSEHFDLSQPIAEIQADIINSLYSPSRQSGDTIMRNATRIIKSMHEFRTGLPEKYQNYFGGTDEWTLDQKSKLVQEITEDEGLTLLKLGISRILLLRALFSLKDLSYAQRRKALVDAIVTSHNTIIVHSQLIRFPNIAFFTSPIPLHIAAMVILYGHMSKCDRLPHHTALEDIWLALDMLPRFRWRWERKDVNGGHPLIAKLAERVMDINLHAVNPTQHPVLLPEPEWEDESNASSPTTRSHQTSPHLNHAPYNPIVYGPHPRNINGGVVSMPVNGHMNGHSPTSPEKNNMVEVPTTLFYPFYPENSVMLGAQNGHQQAYTTSALLAAAAAQPSNETYMSEERSHDNVMWANHRAAMASAYAIPPQA